MRIILIFLLSAISTFITEAFQSNYLLPLEGRLRGGVNVPRREIKYTASVIRRGKFLSQAFLISNRHILLGASTLKEFFVNYVIPQFREYSVIIYGDKGMPPENTYDIEQVECLPSYQPNYPSISHDIAVITLKTVVNADAGSWINLHQFNTNNHVVDPFSPFKVVSLYRDSPKSQIPNIFDVRFRKIHVKIKENLSCGKHPRQLVFCVETENPHTEKFDDTDIGSPLVQNGIAIGVFQNVYIKNYTYTLDGENFKKNIRLDSLSVYTDITKHAEKIQAMMNQIKDVTHLEPPRKWARFDWKIKCI